MFYCDGSLKGLAVPVSVADFQLQAKLMTVAAVIKHF
jgi:hypothetical protein